jgi:uncharacterized membrane protein
VTASIFFELNLPNPTTWFYFSGLLAVALFFKFERVFSVRNIDVLTLYLFVPGFLLLVESGQRNFLGYLWLMIACLYFLLRCLVDLALVRRPALGPNLNIGGLGWLTGALFVGLIAVAARQPISTQPREESTRPPTPIDKLPDVGSKALQPYVPEGVDDLRGRIWAERTLALLCHLSVVVGLVLIGWKHFDDVRAGMSAATFYLLLPYAYMLLPDSQSGLGRWDHAWPMAFLVWTIFCYRRPILAGAFLGVAAGTAFYLLLLLPAWLGFYRGRGACRFLVSFVCSAGLGLACLGGLLWINGELPPSLQSDWTRFDWQPWKIPDPATPGFWQDIPSERVARMPAAYRVPVFICAMVLVLLSTFWPAPKNLAHTLALSAAALISIQFWYADRGGIYVLWFLPLLLLVVFRPNLSAALPPPLVPDDWVARLSRGLWHLLLRRFQSTPPASSG